MIVLWEPFKTADVHSHNNLIGEVKIKAVWLHNTVLQSILLCKSKAVILKLKVFYIVLTVLLSVVLIWNYLVAGFAIFKCLQTHQPSQISHTELQQSQTNSYGTSSYGRLSASGSLSYQGKSQL